MAKATCFKSLLECWTPTHDSLKSEIQVSPIPIAFISTTFTFDADFFDEECLTRFLCMESEKESDGAAFLIEREEKLASLHGGIVLVDQHNCKGERSLRWDSVPCRVKNGIMHAKITILHWSNCIRLIIASANLTPSGYCINQEVFGVVDYFPDSSADLTLILDSLKYLQNLVNDQCGDIVSNRYTVLNAEIKSTLKKWRIEQRQYKKDEIFLKTLFVSPKEKNALIRLREISDSLSSSPPSEIHITSPFFDAEKTPTTPSWKIFEILKQRGNVQVTYNVTTEPVSDTSHMLVVNAPEFLQEAPKPDSTQIFFKQISEEGINEKQKSVPRPLHMKSIWLGNEDVQVYMIGSSNFTSAALGLAKRSNYEANLVYSVSYNKNKKGYNLLRDAYPVIADLDTKLLTFKARVNKDEVVEMEYLHLPAFFMEAVVCIIEGILYIQLNFNAENPPLGFQVFCGDVGSDGKPRTQLLNEEEWKKSGSKMKVNIEWKEPMISNFLVVSWSQSNAYAFWPLIIESQITLPPVENLRQLSLDALLQILSSSQPLHRLLKIIEASNKSRSTEASDIVVDAHKLVNTTGFLLQRTRRVSYAMSALRTRLEKPVFTRESLKWRVYGPIGVNALKEAIRREARSEDEKHFLLAELALELSRINPVSTDVSVNRKEIISTIKEVIRELVNELNMNLKDTSINSYSKNACTKALNEL